MTRLIVALTVGLLGCSIPKPAPEAATGSSPVSSPDARAPAARQEPSRPPARVYFDPAGNEDLGLAAFDGPFGLTPIDNELPEALILDGVRPASVTVLDSLEPYLDTRAASLASYSKQGGLLVLTRLGDRRQAHRVERPLGAREQVTFGLGSVAQASFDPLDPGAVLFRVDLDGSERFGIHRVELDSRVAHAVSAPGGHARSYATNRQGEILVSSYSDDGSDSVITVLRADGEPPREVFRRPGSWLLGGSSPNGDKLLLREFIAADQQSLFMLDLASGQLQLLDGGSEGQVCKSASFTADGSALHVLANRGGDFISLWRVELGRGGSQKPAAWTELTPGRAWDVESVHHQPGGDQLALIANEDGYSVVYLLDPRTKKLREIARPRGVVRHLRFMNKRTLLASVSRSTAPSDVYAYDIKTKKVVRWTRSETGGVPSERFIEPTVVRVRSFDGREVPALYYRPRGEGPFATMIYAHGGPESQTRPSFKPFFQYMAAERGVAILAPNIRGSTGYGLEYMGLDDGTKRMDAIEDIGALLDWIEAQPELAQERVAIAGVSYGGFVTLASMVEHGDRLVAGVDVVGVADIEEFLLNTGEYRRALRRREYGDERDEDTAAWMREVSPLRRAAEIDKPLFVVHGANDPRVPVQSAEKITDSVREAGGEVWLAIAPREGHSIRDAHTRDELLRRVATFLERYLLASRVDEQAGDPDNRDRGPRTGLPGHER